MNKQVFLHVCCAPCLCYPLKKFKEKNFEVCAYWYNPNIHGFREYNKRRMTLGYYLAKEKSLNIIEGSYDIGRWFDEVDLRNKEDRCRLCYRVRLRQTACRASEKGFDLFSTTLLYSKFQKFETIIEEGEKAAEKEGVNFYVEDFRKGWKEGIQISKDKKLYRQEYCGCIFSEEERYG